jgi:Holliday junction DNA helicase RuvB
MQQQKRPLSLEEFIGQSQLKNILETAIKSAQASKKALGHCLFIGESGYGKTTLANIVASMMGTRVKVITAYAINKPSDMVSLLNTLDTHDILFIDEIHRLKSSVEEVLYIAMEDHAIDMLMPDGTHIRLPLRPFTLIGATTKPESLSQPLKNRFIYDCHFLSYSIQEKQEIIKRYLTYESLIWSDDNYIIETIAAHVSDTPREIGNFCVMLHDFCSVHHHNCIINHIILQQFLKLYQRLPG